MHRLLAFFVFAALPLFAADNMDAEIDYLLETIETSGCTFIRNGKEHEPGPARSHLEMKRKRGKRYYDSTEEFIERVASSSSWTGKPYMIRCGSEEPKPIEGWYKQALSDYRAGL